MVEFPDNEKVLTEPEAPKRAPSPLDRPERRGVDDFARKPVPRGTGRREKRGNRFN